MPPRAVEFVDRTDELSNQAGIRMGRAYVLWLARRDDEARTLLEQALARSEQKGNLVMADLARSLLANPSAR